MIIYQIRKTSDDSPVVEYTNKGKAHTRLNEMNRSTPGAYYIHTYKV